MEDLFPIDSFDVKPMVVMSLAHYTKLGSIIKSPSHFHPFNTYCNTNAPQTALAFVHMFSIDRFSLSPGPGI